MVKRDKRIAAMRRNPKNVRPEELDAALRGAGFTVVGQEGSHKTYERGGERLTIPQHRPFLKPVYVRDALRHLEEEDR